jgi:maltooligosyltrehalose synthase
VSAFHGASRDRAQHWPHTLLATSTHDSKRSEDVRARIDVISEMPAAWRLMVRRWSRMNRRHRRKVDGVSAPSRNDEYLLYQTLVGSLPSGALDGAALAAYAQRIEQVMLKSARESKARTSWIQQPARKALSSFVRALSLATATCFCRCAETAAAVLRCAQWPHPGGGERLSPQPDYYRATRPSPTLVDPDNARSTTRTATSCCNRRALRQLPQRAAVLRRWLAQAPDGRANSGSWSVLRSDNPESLYLIRSMCRWRCTASAPST